MASAASRGVLGAGGGGRGGAAPAAGASKRRDAGGVAVVWLRNDLRVHDNEALLRAWESAEVVVPLYCFDPRHFGRTHYFGMPKTGELRAQFLSEAVADLRTRLRALDSDLVIRHGRPEEEVARVAQAVGAHTVFAHCESTDEELRVERGVQRGLDAAAATPSTPSNDSGAAPLLPRPQQRAFTRLQLIWGNTLYHRDDLPFTPQEVPDVYTQFRKAVETRSAVRPPLAMPASLGPFPPAIQAALGSAGEVPSPEALTGVGKREQDPRGVLVFQGGESAALKRLQHYFWKHDCLKEYKVTRNGMLGADYSTKFSPWLALGCISPRLIQAEVMRYEKERVANDSTYWVLFELIWRDYFRFISIKYGNSIFHLGGPRRVTGMTWKQDLELFAKWRDGETGYPLVDANMKELAATGFMSNRGRQIVCSFLVRDMGVDWRMGAEWFESCLLDHDPASNYGNWTYGAGVGNDPREDRYFSIPKQAQTYDPEGAYVAHWLPQLAKLPAAARHAPYKLSPGELARYGLELGAYPGPVVPLKFGGGGGAGRGNGPPASSGQSRGGPRGNVRRGGGGAPRPGSSVRF